MSNEVLLTAVSVLSLAGFVQGLTGFGFGMVAMAMLPALLGMQDAQAIVTVAGFTATLTRTALTLGDVQWTSVGRLWIGSLVGVPLGFALLTSAPQDLVMRGLGLALCAMVMFEICFARRRGIRLPPWSAWGIGLTSGALSGAFNVGGPPLVAYIYDRPWTKEQQVATLNGIFIGTGLVRLGMLLFHEHLNSTTLASAAWAIGPMAIALLCGNWVLGFIPQRHLRTGIYLALLLLGVRYLIFGAETLGAASPGDLEV